MEKKYITNNSRETRKLGEELAKEILRKKIPNRALVICLEGELGGGKTTFLQGFAKGLGVKDKILSPTFVIMKKFRTPSSRLQNFYHVDCYRVEKAKELSVLGFEEIISIPENVIAVEWAERIRKIIPKDAVWIKFEFVDENKRKINIKNY